MRLGIARRPAFTLLEALLQIFALTVAMTLGAALILAAIRTNSSAMKTLTSLSRRSQLADQFRADAAAAFGSAVAKDGASVTLRLAGNEEITYRWEDGQLERGREIRGKTTWRAIPVGDCERVEFTAAGDRGNVVMLRVVGAERNQVPGPALEIAAAVGGDLR